MKAKLAYFCSSESWGGLEMNHLRDAVWMKERGHEIIVLAVKTSPFYLKAEESGLPVEAIDKQKKYYDFSKARQLVHLIRSRHITHLIIRSTYDMSIAASVKSKLKKRIHTVYIQAMQLGVKKKNLMHTIRFRGIDIWVTPLHSLEKQVKEWTNFKNKLVVIPSGLDLKELRTTLSNAEARVQLSLPKEPLLFGLIGRFDPQKGQLLLLEAMSKSHNTDYEVVLLGEPTLNEGNSYYEQMKLILSESKLDDRVHILPFMNNPSVFYKAIDWLVMATKAETFGMVTIEAIASGKPVLGSNAGGTPELLDHETAGKLFETMNANDLALKIDEIIDNKIMFDEETLQKIGDQYDHSTICSAFETAVGLS